LRFLDRTLKIEPGANIYSSGDGGVFPAGVALGKVKAFELKDISGEAVVDAAVNFGLLEDVFVVHMDSPVSP
jgi:rod shape-determining protein MreC